MSKLIETDSRDAGVCLKQAVVIVALITIVAASPASARRLAFKATLDGKQVTGATVCFSRARQDGGALDRMWSGPEVRCLSADQIINIPAGVWHYYITAEPDLIGIDATKIVNAQSGEHGDVDVLTSELAASAWIDLTAIRAGVDRDRRVALYLDADDRSAPIIMPVTPGAERARVPARRRVTPLLLAGDTIERVGHDLEPTAGATARATWDTTAAVIIPFVIPEYGPIEDLPALQFVRRGSTRTGLRVPLAPNRSRGLIFARSLELGVYDIQVDGDAWSAAPLTFVMAAMGEIVKTTGDVVLERAERSLLVSWSMDRNLVEPVRSSCSEENTPDSDARLSIWSCPNGDRVNVRECATVRSSTISGVEGTIRWPSPPLDRVWLQLRRGSAVSVTEVWIDPQRDTRALVTLSVPFIHGRVTYRESPLFALVYCGIRAARSDRSSGEYRCEVPPSLIDKRLRISVEPCDGSATYHHLVENLQAGALVDIDIPSNTLSVRVLNAQSRKPVENALVVASNGDVDDPPGPVSYGRTSEAGVLELDRIQPGIQHRVCASQEFFREECNEIVFEDGEPRRELELLLSPKSEIEGRLLGAPADSEATVHSVRDGIRFSAARLRGDGTFVLDATPPPGATFLLTSRTTGLCILQKESRDGEPLVLRLPAVRPRSFVVSSSAHAPVTLMLGSVLVPVAVFSEYQDFALQPYYTDPGRPIRILNIDEMNGITVVLGLTEIPFPDNDPFRVPKVLSSLPKMFVGDRTTVEFP